MGGFVLWNNSRNLTPGRIQCEALERANRRRLPVAGVSSAVRSIEREQAPQWGVATIEIADQGFDSPMLHKKSRLPFTGGLVFCLSPRGVEPLGSPMHNVHWRGAEPKRCRWQMKRGGSLVSKGVCRTTEKADDYCEPDRTNEVK